MRNILLVTLLMTTACVPKALPPKPIADDRDLQDQLFAADRAFAKAVADSGAPALNARLASDVARPGNGGLILLRGKVPVAADMSSLFADPSALVTWDPTDAVAYADRVTGVTVGRYAMVRRSTRTDTLARGRYLTLWRRQSDGRWTIMLDTGWPDAPPK